MTFFFFVEHKNVLQNIHAAFPPIQFIFINSNHTLLAENLAFMFKEQGFLKVSNNTVHQKLNRFHGWKHENIPYFGFSFSNYVSFYFISVHKNASFSFS